MDSFSAFKETAPYLTHPLALVGLALLLHFGVHRGLSRSGVLNLIPEYEGPRLLRLLLHF